MAAAEMRASDSLALESLTSPDSSGRKRIPKRTSPASAIAKPSPARFRLTSRTSSARKRKPSNVMRAGPTEASISTPANSSKAFSASTRSLSDPMPEIPIA